MTRVPVVCFLTDFGLSDPYAGVMKGVLLKDWPEAQLVDITHDVPPQDVRNAAFQLLESYRYFPEGALFMCVVDPGVGSGRKIIYAEADGWEFLAPDNGLLSWVLEEAPPQRVYALDIDKVVKGPVSRTFHGRDIFAPAAARLLNGEEVESFAQPAKDWVKLPFPHVIKTGAMWMGEILAVDRFGNLITNFRTNEINPLAEKSRMWIEINEKATIRGLSESYAAVEPGKLLAIGGSAGFVEISVRDGNAARQTKLNVGSKISLYFR